jgi:hypothetical protein
MTDTLDDKDVKEERKEEFQLKIFRFSIDKRRSLKFQKRESGQRPFSSIAKSQELLFITYKSLVWYTKHINR